MVKITKIVIQTIIYLQLQLVVWVRSGEGTHVEYSIQNANRYSSPFLYGSMYIILVVIMVDTVFGGSLNQLTEQSCQWFKIENA